MSDDGLQCTTIDDVENSKLQLLIGSIYGNENIVGIVPIKINPSGRPTERGFALTHEYGIFSGKSNAATIAKVPRSDTQMARYNQEDSIGVFEWRNLRREGSNSDRENGERQYYPIYGDLSTGAIRVPKMYWKEECRQWYLCEGEHILNNEVEIYPINDDGREKNWRWSEENVRADYSNFIVRIPQGNTKPQVYYKYRPNMDGITPLTMWTDAKFSATEHGTKVIKDLFKESNFAYPKSIHAVIETLTVMGYKTNKNLSIIDYFAGSGTTGHAIIRMNRNDNGNRKFILVEVNDYFDNVTKARVEKVVYSNDWRDGKPVSRNGISQCFKYIRLEQYEDTLNNLEIKKQQLELQSDEFKESYMLSYMLDTETRDSLLNLRMFEDPFNVTLKTTKDNELVETKVDMVETFNYLIGLNVETEDWYQDDNICVVQGKTHRGGLKTLVIWRNCKAVNNEQLCTFFDKMDFRTRDTEFDLIYVNGDYTLPNLRRDEDHWKVVLTEEEFQKRMFEEE